MDSEDWPIKQMEGYRQPLNNKWEAPGAGNSCFFSLNIQCWHFLGDILWLLLTNNKDDTSLAQGSTKIDPELEAIQNNGVEQRAPKRWCRTVCNSTCCPNGNVGGSQGHTNLPPSLGINFIIAVNGIFPSETLLETDAAVNLAQEERSGSNAGSRGDAPFIGEIIMFAGNFAPKGWAICDGQLLPIAQNTGLFSIIGTAYGGDGRTTFGLPDLRGRAPVGSGTGPGLSPFFRGQQRGVETVTLTVNQIPAHNHPIPSPPP